MLKQAHTQKGEEENAQVFTCAHTGKGTERGGEAKPRKKRQENTHSLAYRLSEAGGQRHHDVHRQWPSRDEREGDEREEECGRIEWTDRVRDDTDAKDT